MHTLANLTNMRAAKDLFPTRQVIAISICSDEECSANPDDYFYLTDDEPLMDCTDQPMILVGKAGPFYFDLWED